MAHWPRVRLTTLLVAGLFLLASSRPSPRTAESEIASGNHCRPSGARVNGAEKEFRKKGGRDDECRGGKKYPNVP